MRPIKLKMTSFQSYLEPQEIDFEKLNEKKIFVISGKTGAGKTTIFDAILYALYGHVSSETRDTAKQLKTRGADDLLYTCEVVLTFEQKGEIYKITRVPAQKLKGARGLKSQASEAVVLECLRDGAKPISKNAQEEINKLLGFDMKQFKQVCMISQGSFSEVLTASTKEKKEIFRELFSTEIFDQFVEKLGEEYKSITAERDLQRRGVEQAYASIKVDPALSEKKESLKEDEERLQFLSDALQNYKSVAESLAEKIEENDKKISELNIRKERAETYLSTQKKLVICESEIQKDQDALIEIRRQLDSWSEKKEDIKKLEEEVTGLKNILPKYEHVEQLASILSKDESTQREALRKKRDFEEQIKTIEQKRSEIQKEKENLRQVIEKEEEVISADNRAAFELKSYESWGGKIPEIQKLYKNFEKKQNDFNDLKDLFDKSSKEFNRLEDLYYSSITGILAKKLVENQPCPVCGSKEHPHPCAITEESVTEEVYKKAKEENEKLSEEVAQERENLSSLTTTFKNKYDEYLKILSREGFAEPDRISKEVFQAMSEFESELLGRLETNKKETERNLKQVRDAKDKTKRNEDQSARLAEEKVEKEQGMKDLEIQIASLKAKIEETASRLKDEKASLEFPAKADAEDEIKRMNDDIKSYEAFGEKKRKALDDVSASKNKKEGEILSLKKVLENSKSEDLDRITEELERCDSEKKTKEKEKQIYQTYIAMIENGISEYKSLIRDFEKQNHRFSIVESLYKVYKGKVFNEDAGKNIDLETYVLSQYLDQIIAYANRRLAKMSDGKYALCRRADDFRGGGQQGLDIDVIDRATDEKRKAETLSGGETFMASLSLALGLSDMVRLNRSQKDIDVLFIDEGFGSLDMETLKLSADTLKELAAEENKLIGLISHVEELFALFDAKIEVSKDHEGHSTAKLKV